ncbi:hypothetical protein Avbf_10860 [Armadillidium vulgare]|nr:hypothetical protein Avbf_10860 [Armadillidium vulgare]
MTCLLFWPPGEGPRSKILLRRGSQKPTRMQGYSITITSLTNMLSFSVGITTPILGVQIFCIYTEKKDKFSYSFWCGGGVNHDDIWNERDNRPNSIMLEFCARFFCISEVLFMVAQPLKKAWIRNTLSNITRTQSSFYRMDSEQFRKFPYAIQIVLTGNITFSNPKTKYELLKLHNDFERLPYTAESLFTLSWIRGWYRFIDSTPELSRNITDEKSFIKYLRSVRYIFDVFWMF